MIVIEAGDLAGKQWIRGKLVAQTCQQLAGAPGVFIAQVGHRKKHSGKGGKEAAMFGGEFQFADAGLLVAFVSSNVQEPADGRGQAADNIVVQSSCQVSVVI